MLTSHPEAGAAYSMDSKRASGTSWGSHVEGQQYGWSKFPGLCPGSRFCTPSRLQVANAPPLMPCTKTTSTKGAPAHTDKCRKSCVQHWFRYRQNEFMQTSFWEAGKLEYPMDTSLTYARCNSVGLAKDSKHSIASAALSAMHNCAYRQMWAGQMVTCC